MLGKNFSRPYFEIFLLFFLENRIWHFMQIVSLGDNLHDVSNPVFLEKKKEKNIILCLSSVELAHSTESVQHSSW